MLNKTNWKAWIVLGLAVSVLVTSGGLLMASNVGFKLHKALANLSANNTQRGHNWTAIAFNNPYTNLKGICNALVAKGATQNTTFVEQVNANGGAIVGGNCALALNFPLSLNGGPVGVNIRQTGVGGAGSIPSVVFVGSSNEALTTATMFVPPAKANSQNGHNWIPVPYHSTWSKAGDICSSLGFPCPGPAVCGTVVALGAQISRIDATTGTTSTFICGNIPSNPANFSLVIGEAVRFLKTTCQVGPPCPIAAFLPPHF